MKIPHENLLSILLHVCVLLILLSSKSSARLAKPENFFGSDSLLEGYFDEAQHYVDVFTLRPEVTIEATPDEIPKALQQEQDAESE